MMPRALMITFALLLLAVIGAAGYLLVLRHNAERTAQHVETAVPAPPLAGATQHVVFFEADDASGAIRRSESDIALPADASERDRQVLHALMGDYVKRPSEHELAAGADVRSVYLLPNHLAVIDMTTQFADGHRSGVLVEMLTVASLVQTLCANDPAIQRVKILVDGKERESLAGHADLARFYDVAQVAELIKQLQ